MENKQLSRLLDRKEKLEAEKDELMLELNNVEEDLVQVRLDLMNLREKTNPV